MSDEIIQSLLAEIAARRESLVALCADLVAVPSVNPPGDTARVAEVVQRYLAAAGVDTDVIATDPATPNVIGTVTGRGRGRHIVFNAHMDTMEPGRESDWSVPPFQLTRKDGRIYGLGMGNMKGALAAMCLVTALLHRYRDAWPGRLTMTAVSDEVMFGERGSAAILSARTDLKGDALISGEGPGYMGLAVAEKGVMWFDVETTAAGGHSSRATRGNGAISELAAALERLDTLNEIYATTPAELHGLDAGEGRVGLRVSFNPGKILGGSVRGQIARHAKAEVDVRLPPGFTMDELLRRARELTAPFPNTVIRLVRGWDASWISMSAELTRAVAEASTAVRGGRPAMVVRLPASDAMRWRALGVPAICFGPQPTLSAGCDDHVIEQDLLDCASIYARATLELLSATTAHQGSDSRDE